MNVHDEFELDGLIHRQIAERSRLSLFRQYKRIGTQHYGDGRKDNSRCKLRDLTVANGGGSWGGCIDNGGVAPKLSNRFFGALAGARFFFGFRPRLLGIGKQLVRSVDKVSASRQCRPTPPDGWPSAFGS